MAFPPAALAFLLASSASKMTTKRQFKFVGFGSSFSDPDRPTISCDGRVSGGVTLELTHWNGNETPDELYADTSTEMALKLARHENYSGAMKDAWVLNNHFDTDGALSVWACLEPEQALEYSDLLIQGAEAGDFGEWSELGIKLDSTLLALGSQSKSDDEAAFQVAFKQLPSILQDLKTTGGKSYEDLWKPGFESAKASWELIQNRKAVLEQCNEDGLVILKAPAALPPISAFALHRGLKENGWEASTKRVLRVSEYEDSTYSYQYEKAGHGWVNKLVQRPMVPLVDAGKLVEKLKGEEAGCKWKVGGPELISICRSAQPTSVSIDRVADLMTKYDEGLSTV